MNKTLAYVAFTAALTNAAKLNLNTKWDEVHPKDDSLTTPEDDQTNTLSSIDDNTLLTTTCDEVPAASEENFVGDTTENSEIDDIQNADTCSSYCEPYNSCYDSSQQ